MIKKHRKASSTTPARGQPAACCRPRPARSPRRGAAAPRPAARAARAASTAFCTPRVHARRGGGADRGGRGEAAEAPARVEGGHDRPPERLSIATPWAFMATSIAPLEAPNSEQREREQPRLGREQQHRTTRHAGRRADARALHAADPDQHLAHQRHRDDHADRHRQQDEPERALGELEPVLDERDLRDPRPDGGAVDEEDADGGDTRSHRLWVIRPRRGQRYGRPPA